MPDGLAEFALIILVILALLGLACLVTQLLLGHDIACQGQVVENVETGTLHDAAEWELQLLPGYTGPWPCPNIEPCPIHGRTQQ